jgi:Flp pilus assembly protein TadD
MFDCRAVLTIALAASLTVSLPLVAQDLGRLDQRTVGLPGKDGPEERVISNITGVVRTQDDRPLQDARVEVHEVSSGTVLASGYTSPSGSFEVAVPDGTYEVVATSGLSESRERIRVDGAGGSVTLRMPHIQGATPAGETTVSVAAMRVPDKAKKEFEKAREALIKNELEESRKHLAKALDIYPHYSDALALRGVTAMAANDLQSAADDLNAAIQNDSNNSSAYVAMGALYNRSKRFDDALRSLDRGVALNPTSWQAFFEMSRAELGKGDFESALRQATKAEELLGRVYDPIYLVKAHAMLGMKNYQAAITEFEKYLSAEKDDAAANEVRQQVQQIRSFMASAK